VVSQKQPAVTGQGGDVKEKVEQGTKGGPAIKEEGPENQKPDTSGEGEGEEKPLDNEAVGLFVKGQLKEGSSLKTLYHAVRLQPGEQGQALVKQVVGYIFELRKQGIVLGNQHAPVAAKFGSSFGPLVQAANAIELTSKGTTLKGYETVVLYSNWQAAQKVG